jgi:hypothetical protein
VARPNESTDYSVNVCPLYDDEDGAGELCAYAHSPNIKDAMLEAASLTEHWIKAPSDYNEGEREPLVGFEIVVSSPGWPDPA